MVITPLGARINRAYLAGVLMIKENMGDDVEPFWKFQVQDGLGRFYLSAGQYQSEASAALFMIEEPALVAVVAKSRTFTTEEGDLRPSFRAESVYRIDEERRARWTLETARHTLLRMRARMAAEEMSEPDVEKLVEQGFPREVAVGAVLSLDYYPAVDYERFREGLKTAIEEVLQRGVSGGEEQAVEVERGESEDLKAEVYRIIKKATEERGQIELKDLQKRAQKLELDEAALDEVLLELIEEGSIYEPKLGMFKALE
ncbi:MAG: hypothetical protein J7K08_06785 [Thermoplasmata archaeon]|nr:hypothetical protein [Thermoplasmata archaeon]